MSGWTGVLFNSTDLSTVPGVMINNVSIHKRPARIQNRQKLARQDGAKLISSEYGERIIDVGITMSASSRADYETKRDVLFKILDISEATLRIPQAGANRDYTASVDDVDYPEEPSGGLAIMNVKFVASNPPFGRDTSNTTACNTSFTGSSKTSTFVLIGGTVVALPVITITLTAGTGLTSKYIQITNPSTGKLIRITRTWVAGDILIIDCENKTVKVNGTDVDYTGVFPTWSPDDTQIQYDDTLTTRTVTMNMVYKKRYL